MAAAATTVDDNAKTAVVCQWHHAPANAQVRQEELVEFLCVLLHHVIQIHCIRQILRTVGLACHASYIDIDTQTHKHARTRTHMHVPHTHTCHTSMVVWMYTLAVLQEGKDALQLKNLFCFIQIAMHVQRTCARARARRNGC